MRMKCDERKSSEQYNESHLNMFCSCCLGSITHRPAITTYAEESSRDTIEQDTKMAFCIPRKPTVLTNASLIFANSCTTFGSISRFSYTTISVEPSCLKQSSGYRPFFNLFQPRGNGCIGEARERVHVEHLAQDLEIQVYCLLQVG